MHPPRASFPIFLRVKVRNVLTVPCTEWLFQRFRCSASCPSRLFSILILDPLLIALCVLRDPLKLVKAGSVSDFTHSNAIFQSHAINLRQTHSPVNFLGATMLNTVFVSFSSATRNANFSFLLISREHVVQMYLGDTTFFFGRFPTVLDSSSALAAMSTPAPERKMRHIVLNDLLLAWLTRIMFAHCVPASRSSSPLCSPVTHPSLRHISHRSRGVHESPARRSSRPSPVIAL